MEPPFPLMFHGVTLNTSKWLGLDVRLAESSACSMLTYRGMQGWRLPTVKELATLTRQFCIQDSCYTLSATPSTRVDATGAFTNSLFFSPASDILPHRPVRVMRLSA